MFLGLLTSLVLILTIIFEFVKDKLFLKAYYYPRVLSHLGVGILLLSIFLNGFYSESKDFEIQLGENKEFNNLSLKFVNQDIYKINNYLEMKTDFEISKDNQIFTLKPSVRRYFQPVQITSETSIKPTILSNHYLAVNFPNQNENVLGARYYFNFFIHGIWLGMFLIVFGGMFSAFKKRN